jgi:hypothetical protein
MIDHVFEAALAPDDFAIEIQTGLTRVAVMAPGVIAHTPALADQELQLVRAHVHEAVHRAAERVSLLPELPGDHVHVTWKPELLVHRQRVRERVNRTLVIGHGVGERRVVAPATDLDTWVVCVHVSLFPVIDTTVGTDDWARARWRLS